MLEYFEKFNNLPNDVKQKVSSGAILATIEALEEKYGVPLATFVMRVMVGDLYYKNIIANLIVEYDLDVAKAGELEKELKEKVFFGVKEYLEGGQSSRPKPAPEAPSPFYVKKNVPPAVKPISIIPSAVKQASPVLAKGSLPGPIVRRAPTPVVPVKNFLQDDEKDIAAMGKMTSSFKAVVVGKNEAMLEEIVKEAKISFASAEILKRFKDILSTYLRGIRTKVEVKENLMKDVSSGGIRFAVVDADRILAIAQKRLLAEENKFSSSPGKVSARTTGDGTSFIFNEEEIKQALSERSKAVKSNPINFGARDVEYDLTALSKKAPVALPEKPMDVPLSGAVAAQAVSMTEVKPAVPVSQKVEPEKIPAPIVEIKKIEPIVASVKKEIIEPVKVPQKAQVPEAETKRVAAVPGNKKRMEDIKLAPKLMSPIDELGYMDLVNFRRLDENPSKRIAKIEEKINLLEKEGIDKKIEGIRAWRTNPVSKTYLSMGQESIGGGKNIDDIIKDRKAQGLNYLTKEEFEAVMDLNDKLRF